MADDWRVTVDFDADQDGTDLVEWLRAIELAGEERERLGDRVVVSRDGPRVYLYTDSEERARETERLVAARLADGPPARISISCWHPIEQVWEDPSVPLPRSDEEIEAERERLLEREAAESRERGYAAWEVRVELPSHEDTVELAERLESEELPVVRRHTFLLVGAADREEAEELAERLRSEAPPGARVEVEPGGGLAWEVGPKNPFAIFGGLGA